MVWTKRLLLVSCEDHGKTSWNNFSKFEVTTTLVNSNVDHFAFGVLCLEVFFNLQRPGFRAIGARSRLVPPSKCHSLFACASVPSKRIDHFALNLLTQPGCLFQSFVYFSVTLT